MNECDYTNGNRSTSLIQIYFTPRQTRRQKRCVYCVYRDFLFRKELPFLRKNIQTPAFTRKFTLNSQRSYRKNQNSKKGCSS